MRPSELLPAARCAPDVPRPTGVAPRTPTGDGEQYGTAQVGGYFFSFEGGEACGKSTQLSLLREALTAAGREVVCLREPGGTDIGERIRHLLQHDPSGHALSPEAEVLLFAASRAQLVREIIRPALERGAVVLCDRFLDSTTVYQGVARALDTDAVARLNAFAVGETLPHRTFLLDVPVHVAQQRLHGRGAADRFESEPLAFHEAVRQGYLTLARAEPHRICLLPAEETPELLHIRIRDFLNQHYGLFTR